MPSVTLRVKAQYKGKCKEYNFSVDNEQPPTLVEFLEKAKTMVGIPWSREWEENDAPIPCKFTMKYRDETNWISVETDGQLRIAITNKTEIGVQFQYKVLEMPTYAWRF